MRATGCNPCWYSPFDDGPTPVSVGGVLVGRCVLYSYRFVDPLIRGIATGNGWDLGQPIWMKPNDVKSLQTWESRMRQASGQRSMTQITYEEYCVVMLEDVDEVFTNDANRWRSTCQWRSPTYRETFESKNVTDFKGFEALHNTFVDIDDQLLCSEVQTEARQMYDELRRSFETCNEMSTNWHWMSNMKIHAFAANDFAWHV